MMQGRESVARLAAARAGEIVREHWERRKVIDRKSTTIDLVTETDRASEAAILEIIEREYPADAILAEESGARGAAEITWVVDPLDGTTNFAHSFPHVAVSIAVVRDGRSEIGVVYDPLRNELFEAVRGGGAFMNGAPIHVSPTDSLATALLATGFPYDRRDFTSYYLAHLKAFMMLCHGVRRGGSAALDLCYVASGRVDGFWEWKLKPWDMAAGALLVEEAGGKIGEFSGATFDLLGEQCLATNGSLHAEMLRVLGPLAARCPW